MWILSWLFFLFSPAAFSNVCDELAKELGEAHHTQALVLEEFTIGGLKFDKAVELAHNVYKIPHQNGFQYVIRFNEAGNHNVAFESFAGAFLESFDHSAVAKAKLLSGPDSKLVRTSLQAPAARNAKASVALYYPVPNANKYLSDKGIGGELRTFLIEMYAGRSTLQTPEQRRVFLKHRLENSSENELKSVYNDLKNTCPDFKEVSFVNFTDKLFDFLTSQNLSSLRNFSELSVGRLSPELRTQIADHWAVWYVLGLEDFNPNNFLIYKNQPISVDLAGAREAFTKGKDAAHASLPFPIISNDSGPEVMAKFLSAKMVELLKAADAQSIQSIADQNDFKISEVQKTGMLKRRDRIMSGL